MHSQNPSRAPAFYETDRALAEYLLFHYGAPAEILPYPFGPRDALDFAVRCVTECVAPERLASGGCALDLGCAVGRSSFELARHCSSVVGIDKSERFVAAARKLQQEGSIPFACVEEGMILRQTFARVPADIERRRVSFEQGDAADLRRDLGAFDVVLMANLIDRLDDPRRCLERLPELVKRGGQLIITSPYTWLSEYTAPENWLGGCEREGKQVRTFESLQAALGAKFELAARKDLPFLLREHARKYQWSVAEASVWLKK